MQRISWEQNLFMSIPLTSVFTVNTKRMLQTAPDSIKITFGHAKDGRKDLKRFVLGLVADQFGIPLFAEAFDGNKSDKEEPP